MFSFAFFYTLWCIRHQYAPCDCSSLITSSFRIYTADKRWPLSVKVHVFFLLFSNGAWGNFPELSYCRPRWWNNDIWTFFGTWDWCFFFSDKHQCKGNKARFRKTPLYVLLNVLVYVFTSTSKKKQNKTKQNKTKNNAREKMQNRPADKLKSLNFLLRKRIWRFG